MKNEGADISFFVVALNQLVAELNKVTRDIQNCDVEEIWGISNQIAVNAQMLKEMVKR